MSEYPQYHIGVDAVDLEDKYGAASICVVRTDSPEQVVFERHHTVYTREDYDSTLARLKKEYENAKIWETKAP